MPKHAATALMWFFLVDGRATLQAQTRQITIDAAENLGAVTHLLGTNGRPFNGATDYRGFYRGLGFQVIGTHDWYGPGDWHTIFPIWAADPERPASYNC